jgi:hypothetical protein
MSDLGSQPWLGYALVLAAGVGGGFLNTVSGGGGLLTVPALVLLGLPTEIANGTSRLAIVTQSLSGVWAFHREGKLPVAAVGPVVTPTVLGGALGAAAAAWAPADIIEPVLLGTMIAMAALMLAKPTLVSSEPQGSPRDPLRHAPSFAALFAAGVYGGFVQAGVGVVLLAVLGGLLRFDMARANALKLACTLSLSVPAITLFAAAGRVAWWPSVVLAVGTVLGSQLGVRFAVKMRARTLRWITLVAVVATCIAALLKR